MTRVEIASQGWGWVADPSGNGLAAQTVTIANTDGSAATHWSALTGGSSSTASISTNSDGTIPRFIESGTYDLTVGAVTRRVEAVSGEDGAGAAVWAIGAGIDYTGVADSSAALQAKMDEVPAGGKLILRPGILRCTSTLVRTGAQGPIHFEGAGGGSIGSTLKLQHATTGIDFQGSVGTPIVGVSFDHITIGGNFTTPATLVKMTSCWVVNFSADTELYDAPLLAQFTTCGHMALDGVANWNTVGSQVGYEFTGCTGVKLGGTFEGKAGGTAKFVHILNSLCRDFSFVGVRAFEEHAYFMHVNSGGIEDLAMVGCNIRETKTKAIVQEPAASTHWRIVGNVFSAGSGATHGIHCTAGTDIVETDNSFTGFTNETVLPTPTVASASNITLPQGQWVEVSGTTTITSITASRQGRVVVLRFTSTAQVTDGSNLKLAGNFTGSADRTLTLVSDGTNWIEISRSAN